MSPAQPLISQVASDVLTGFYKRKRLTQEELAERSEIPLTSLQKKLRGTAPVTATDLVVISNAIGVSPTIVMEEILRELAEREQAGMSDGPVSLEAHRTKKSVAEMTDDEIEAIEKKAAIYDTELEQDEPELP
ncbi:helix-turn-helix domain-containing protein [Microbacterium gilvum]|uniref:HTH cro/C1-type domain-containing protein n=1 Tax=Microbacterium gilvum TaxID=1336204 RepID=A0ABP9A673_9MICO